MTRPTGFEPVTFGSVGGRPTCAASLFPPGIACRADISMVTRADTRRQERARFVPTSFPPVFPPHVPLRSSSPCCTGSTAPAYRGGRRPSTPRRRPPLTGRQTDRMASPQPNTASEPQGLPPASTWLVLTNYAHVLLWIAQDPRARARDIAGEIGITERATQRILGDLIADGYITRTKVGRRNHDEIDRRGELRHPVRRELRIGPLRDVLESGGRPRRGNGRGCKAPQGSRSGAAAARSGRRGERTMRPFGGDAAAGVARRLQRGDVDGLRALVAGLGVVGDLRVLGQQLEAVGVDAGVVDEEVLATVVRRDEAEALVVVEPLDGSGSHDVPPRRLCTANAEEAVTATTAGAEHCVVGARRARPEESSVPQGSATSVESRAGGAHLSARARRRSSP